MSDIRDIFTSLDLADKEAKARLAGTSADPAQVAAPSGQDSDDTIAAAEGTNRRPITSRGSWWARALSNRLTASEVTPNQISQASMGFAAFGLALLWGASVAGLFWQSLWLILAALTMQARLICNLVDGMVAVEGGKKSPTGPFWNEAPDRVADVLFLWGAGIAAGQPALGLGCAALAVGTAYVRELGRAEGLGSDFRGPMAKPHRMALLTVGCLAAALLPVAQTAQTLLGWTLWVMIAGLIVTLARRTIGLLDALNTR